ncbi:MAG: HAD family phosphatase [Betaproteobacteria bacterium]|jgi:2-haloacid dehalogenase/putative hydrolase of the HAD superfamily|nr:HAD family phosphatase [Burkholderiales bacterium]NBX13769.1 HAD family phosphatase [Betaproteobacteria bacterium]NBX91106.1 HAD family phosphatase [Betaproteobacteria bacterium]
MDVVFDLGGVVFQWRPQALMQQLFPQHAPDAAAAQKWTAQIFESFDPQSDWAQFDLGQITPQALAKRIAKRTGLQEVEITLLITSIPNHLVAQEGTVEIIHALKKQGHRLFYLSNMPAGYAAHLISRNDFFSQFDDGIFSAHVNQMKPSAEIFKNANQRFGVSGPGTLFIDDVQYNIDAAQAHGWTGIRFDNSAQVRQDLLGIGAL